MRRKGRVVKPVAWVTALFCVPAATLAADADTLVGIHQWGLQDGTLDYTRSIDPVPAQMLDSRNRGAWDVEVVNTHGDVWQQAGFFVPLFRVLYTDKKVSIVTRVEYKYGQTIPAPTTINPTTWAGNVAGVVGTLKNWTHVWQLGNEPNLIESGGGWTNNQISPRAYADAYKLIRDRLQQPDATGVAGPAKLLVAPVSPGGVIPGVRWRDGSQYLGETIDAIHTVGSPIDGFAVHAYGGGATTADALRDFHAGFAEQVAIIDAKGHAEAPVYITEWNRFATPTGPDAARQEALAADFARQGLRMLDRWNRTPGNHNIVSAGWFVYEKSSNNGTGAWDGYSIDYWKDHGNPRGSSGDLYTAFEQAARAGYKAGLVGARPMPAGVQIIDDFEANDGHFTWTPTQSPTTVGALASSSRVRTAEDSYTKSYSQKLRIVDDASRSNGWYVRYVSGGGSPASNTLIPLNDGTDDGSIGFFLRVLSNSNPQASPLSAQLILDSGAGGGADSDAGVSRDIIGDGDWHYYEWDLDDPADWTAWRDINGAVIGGSDGRLPPNGAVSIDSIVFRGGNATVEFYLDGVMRNANGSLSAMLPVPEPGAAGGATLLLGLSLLRRRRCNG